MQQILTTDVEALISKWEKELKELTEARINETDFSIKNILADKENFIESFIAELYKIINTSLG